MDGLPVVAGVPFAPFFWDDSSYNKAIRASIDANAPSRYAEGLTEIRSKIFYLAGKSVYSN
jgi:hypothetical protein